MAGMGSIDMTIGMERRRATLTVFKNDAKRMELDVNEDDVYTTKYTFPCKIIGFFQTVESMESAYPTALIEVESGQILKVHPENLKLEADPTCAW